MKKETKVMSTLINAQQAGSNAKVEGYCTGNYSSNSTSGNVSCGSGYGSGSGGVSSTSEELDILV